MIVFAVVEHETMREHERAEHVARLTVQQFSGSTQPVRAELDVVIIKKRHHVYRECV